LNSEIFSEWLRRQNYRVFRTESSNWYEKGKRVLQAFPYHWIIEPTEIELYELLATHGYIGLRYSRAIETTAGCLSYHGVLERSPYDLNALCKKARYDVRQGLKKCHIEQISFDQLAHQGWSLQMDTLDRQGRGRSMTFTAWKRACLAAQDLPGFEAWGAIIQGQLGASAMICQIDDWSYILCQQSRSKYLPDKVNNVLAFLLTKEILVRPQINNIHYGLQSLDAPASVDEFKFRMGYIPKPVRQRAVFHPYLRPLINRFSHGAMQRLNQWIPGHPILAKAEGMVRFYLEGLKPLQDQQWPACLEGRKEEILAATMNGPQPGSFPQ
jgi:hypothetical protein